MICGKPIERYTNTYTDHINDLHSYNYRLSLFGLLEIYQFRMQTIQITTEQFANEMTVS